jgi:RNA ligase (TIGR02306 family)
MSTLVVEVCEVSEILPHENADNLEILVIKGWKVIAQKNFLKAGDKCVYFPPDSVMSHALAERLNIVKYLSPLAKNLDGTRPDGLRVRATRLRGISSYGTIMECENPEWPVGHDVMEHYGISKYEPPIKLSDGDAAPDHPALHRYTGIENIGNFPNILKEGEEVIYTEKIHGCLHKYSDITLMNNEVKKLEEVKVGEKIRSFNGKEYVEDIVKKVIVRESHPDLNWLELAFDNGQKLICTDDHPILTSNRGWVPAGELEATDFIL